MTRLIFSLAALACLPAAARADAKTPTFADDVAPMLRRHCGGCHGNDKQRGGLNLATFGVTMEGGSSGAVVVPGDPDKSRLYLLTAHKEEPVMPPSKTKIPDADLELMRLWIEQGGRDTMASKVSVSAKPKVEIGLKSVGKGRPDGPPPMPEVGKLTLETAVHARRPGAVLGLAASPWAPLVAVGGLHQVMLYHANSGQLLGLLPFEHGQINSVKFSRNGKFLLAAGGHGGLSGHAVLYNIETGAKVTEVGSAETDAILCADISADQTLIAVGTATRLVRIYAVADGSVVQQIKKHTDWVTAVEFSPDGVLLASADRNGGAFVWEAQTAREFHSLRGHTAMITDLNWRADSNLLATGSLDTTVRLWEMENGGQIKNWGAHGGGVEGVSFGMDGRLVSTGRDKVAKLWDANGTMLKQFPPLPDTGLRAALSHDGKSVVAGDLGGALHFWTSADAKLVATGDTNPAPLAEQAVAALKALGTAQVAAKAQAAAHAAAAANAAATEAARAAGDAALAKAKADLAAATKAAADHTAAAKVYADKAPALKAEADKQAAALTAASNKAAAVEVTAAAAADGQKRVAESAAKAPQNPELAAAAKAAAELHTKQQAELAAVRKQLADVTAAHKPAADALAANSAALAASQAAVAEAQKQVAALTAAVKAGTDAAPAAKKAADDAAAAVPPLKAASDAAAAAVAAAQVKIDQLAAVLAKK